MEDADALQRCGSGDMEAFGILVARYQGAALGHARAILGNREDAREEVQEAFLRAFKALSRFKHGRPFYPWFYTILRHRCFRRLAERRRSSHAPLEDCAILAEDSREEARPRTQLLERALRALTAEDRELLTLKHLDGLTYRELAARLEIPEGTVMSRLYHARRHLRDAVVALESPRAVTGRAP